MRRPVTGSENSMNKKILIVAAVVAVGLVGAIFLLARGGRPSSQGTGLPDEQFESWLPGLSGGDIFDEEGMLGYEELMAAARTGKISLVSELWRMRRKCGSQDIEKCDEELRAFLKEKFKFPDNEKLTALLDKYITYEKTMRQFKMPDNLNSQQKYALIREQRRKIFGEEDANLVFGLEEAKATFSFQYQDFVKSTAGQKGDARVARYEEMRKKTYGPYYDAILAAEPPFNRFETEVMLRDTDLAGAGAGKASMMQSIREKYFGPEGAARMAEVDKQLDQEESREKELEAAEKKFLAENPGLSEADKEKKLLEIRTQVLGADEAEAYTRRKKLEQVRQPVR